MTPRPPRGVVAVLPDGTEQPVTLVYTGRRRGLHRWIAEHPVAHSGPLQVRVAHAVPNSCIAVDVIDQVPPVPYRR